MQQLDLIGQSLQGRVVKSVVLATHAVAGASASAPSDPVLTQLMGLLRAALIDKGLRVEDIKTTENVPTRRDDAQVPLRNLRFQREIQWAHASTLAPGAQVSACRESDFRVHFDDPEAWAKRAISSLRFALWVK